MKVFIVLIGVLITNLLSSQVSYEFQEALPPNSEKIEAISSIYFGKYKNEETGTVFLFDEKGLTMITLINSFITKEQVRESSKFQVRNGHIFGVIPDDSLPCVYENEKYYFGIQQKTLFSTNTNQTVFKKINEKTYMINFKEEHGYSPSLITFVGKNMVLKHFNYPSETEIFNPITNQSKTNSIKGQTTILLNPTKIEWEKLDQQIIFDSERIFKKVK